MKRQLEFFAADAMAWREAQQPGTKEKVLSRDADDPAVLTFRAGYYASRRPGMPHGPYRTPVGCTMLEIRYRVTAR